MNNKLTTGDSFPALTLTSVDGTQLSLPEQLSSDLTVSVSWAVSVNNTQNFKT